MERTRRALASKPLLSDTHYDFLKWIAQIFLPASGALYFGLAQIWGLPSAEEVIGTITVVDLFLGTLLGISANRYNNSTEKFDGMLLVNTEDEAKDVYTFAAHLPLEELREKDQLIFKVQKP